MGDRIRQAGQVAWALAGLTVILVILGYLGWYIRIIWPPLLLAGIIVFLLNPIVTWLQNKRVPRPLGAGITYLGVIGVVVLAGVLISPQVRTQWDELADRWPDLRDEMEDWVDDRSRQAEEEDWPVDIPTSRELEDALFGNDSSDDGDGDGNGDGGSTAGGSEGEGSEGEGSSDSTSGGSSGGSTDPDRADRLLDTIDSAREIGLRVLEIGIIILMAPIIAFYLLVDLPHIRRVTESMVPESRREEALMLGRRLNRTIGGYFRGQLAVATIVGVMAAIGLAVIDLPFWIVLGLIVGITNMIPMIGPWVGAIPAVVIALTTRDVGTALWAVGILAGVQQIDNHFISPVIMKRAVKLHPAVVMLALLAGGSLFGFIGLLLVVPIVAVLKVLVGHMWRVYVLGQSLETTELAFQAMLDQPGAAVADVDRRDEYLDTVAYPLHEEDEPHDADSPDDGGGEGTAEGAAAAAAAAASAAAEGGPTTGEGASGGEAGGGSGGDG